MLAIKKRHRVITAVTTGSLAFAIGLSGAAAYVGSNIAHQNLTFSKEQTSSSQPSDTPRAGSSEVKVEDASSSDSGLYAPQSSFAQSPGMNTSTAPSRQVSVSPAPTTQQVTETVTQAQPAPAPAPAPDASSELTLCADLPFLQIPVPGVNCRS